MAEGVSEGDELARSGPDPERVWARWLAALIVVLILGSVVTYLLRSSGGATVGEALGYAMGSTLVSAVVSIAVFRVNQPVGVLLAALFSLLPFLYAVRAEDDRREQAVRIVTPGVGLDHIDEPVGRCLVDEVVEMPRSVRAELAKPAEAPSAATADTFREAAVRCGVDEHGTAEFVRGVGQAGVDVSFIDRGCVVELVGTPELALFFGSGNHSLVDVPDGLDPDDPIAVVYSALEPCLSASRLLSDTAFAGLGGLTPASSVCVDEALSVPGSLAQAFFAGSGDADLLNDLMAGCLTEEEWLWWVSG